MLQLPEVIEFEKLFNVDQNQNVTYTCVDGFPIYDDNGVVASLAYGFIFPNSGNRELLYDKDIFMEIVLMIEDNSDNYNSVEGKSLIGEIKYLEFVLDGETVTEDEPFKIQGNGDKSKSAAYLFLIKKSVFDALVSCENRSLKVCGTNAFFEGNITSESFHYYSLLFSKLADKWRETLGKSNESCVSIFPELTTLNEELSGDKDLDRYIGLAKKENKSAIADLREVEAPASPKVKTGALIKEAETLRKKYNKSLTSYSIPRYEAIYKSGYVIAEIGANKVIDVGFYNNPNLDSQFTPNVGGQGDSGILGALQEAAAESYAEKKKNEAIEKASKESTATFIIYAVPQDPDHFKMDILFSNRSKNRSMDNPVLQIEPTYTSSEIKGTTHKSRPGNYYEDVMTVSLPFDYLYSIKGKDATFVFDGEVDDGNDAVMLSFKVRYELMDLITVDYLVRGEYWEQSKRDSYESLLIKSAQLYLQSNDIDSVNKKDEDTENTYKGIGCISAIAVTLLIGIVLSNVLYSEGWPIAIGIALGVVAYYFINKKGKDKTKLSRKESDFKAAALKKDIANLKKGFETKYADLAEE